MKNQHQSGQFPWKLKLSHRHLRAGAGLFWAGNHCVQRREHRLSSQEGSSLERANYGELLPAPYVYGVECSRVSWRGFLLPDSW